MFLPKSQPYNTGEFTSEKDPRSPFSKRIVHFDLAGRLGTTYGAWLEHVSRMHPNGGLRSLRLESDSKLRQQHNFIASLRILRMKVTSLPHKGHTSKTKLHCWYA